jgi:hypothetical protein
MALIGGAPMVQHGKRVIFGSGEPRSTTMTKLFGAAAFFILPLGQAPCQSKIVLRPGMGRLKPLSLL